MNYNHCYYLTLHAKTGYNKGISSKPLDIFRIIKVEYWLRNNFQEVKLILIDLEQR